MLPLEPRRGWLGALLVGVILLVTPACSSTEPGGGDPNGGLRLEIAPLEGLVDEPVSVRVTGCPLDEPVTVRAWLGKRWRSVNVFRPLAGVVDLAEHAPISGSYAGADAMGFVWSMTRVSEESESPAPAQRSAVEQGPEQALAPVEIQLEVLIAGQPPLAATLIRHRLGAGVQRIPVRKDGLVGTLFVPESPEPVPGLLVLGGSGGGLNEGWAALLASRGVAAFALAYFAHEDLPEYLQEIPLEYFRRALRLMQEEPRIDAARIGVIGGSRGGELALLLGATWPEVRCVIGYVPSGLVWGGWTLAGDAVPSVQSMGDPELLAEMARLVEAGEAVAYTPWFLSAFRDRDAVREAEIAVEHTRGPILLVSGDDDALWPSHELSEIAVERCREHSFEHRITHLHYPDAGHLIGPPYWPTTATDTVHPITGERLTFGGTAAGNAHAGVDSWREVLAFLEEAFGLAAR